MKRNSILSVLVLPLLSLVFLLGITRIYADTTPTPSSTVTPTPDSSQAEQDVRNRIKELEGKITDLKGQEKSLSSQIDVMDSQINLTELRISSTKNEIAELEDNIAVATNKIDSLSGSMDKVTRVLLNRIIAMYKVGSTPPLQNLVSAKGVDEYLDRSSYIKIAQEHDKQLIIDIQQAKDDYANQKQIFEDKQKQLEALKVKLEDYTKELDAEQQQKKTLLSQTKGDEANYQRLLAAAKAQLAGFSRFTSSQGGAGLLSNQTVCDDWGCYYNQRDVQWGGMSLNGTQYTIASDGCLVTSMAMILSHYGHKVTPVDINSDSDNFASYYPAYLLYTISAGGVTAERVSTTIDATLSNGDPVVVGVHAYGGTHFVVLVSGSNGDYIMNDPYVANGHMIPFTDHYSVSSIFEIDKVVIH